MLARGPRVVGCTSTFNQHCAALALTRRVKELDPTVITVLGGGNCEGEMGLTTTRQFPWVDFVVSGEAEELFPPFCKTLLDARGADIPEAEFPYGVFGACTGGPCRCSPPSGPVPRAIVKDLDQSPLPDFDDYFLALGAFADRHLVEPGLLAETSRGCWWGMTNHCTFCGLNGGGMTYRSKSPAARSRSSAR